VFEGEVDGGGEEGGREDEAADLDVEVGLVVSVWWEKEYQRDVFIGL